MSVKMKLGFIFISFVLVLLAFVSGAFALTEGGVPFGGSIVFETLETNVYVNTVTLKNTAKQLPNGGYQAADIVLTDYSNFYVQPASEIDISSATVFAGQTLEIDIEMKTMSTTEYARPVLTFSNLPSSVTITSNGQYITSTASVYKIYIRNSSQGTVNLANINMNMSFTGLSRLLQNDTANGYYYVEMGTYSTPTSVEYIRWRYFSNGTSAYTYNASTAPSGSGYFILETDLSNLLDADGNPKLNCVYCNHYYNTTSSSNANHADNGWTNIPANDYCTSTVRHYINGVDVYKNITTSYGPTGTKSNMYADLNIDIDNNIIYERIQTRTLSDLYLTIGVSNVQVPDFLDTATIKYDALQDADKFWILSNTEYYNLLPDGNYHSISYHSRTPYEAWTTGISYVSSLGTAFYGSSQVNTQRFVRPAFEMYVQ